MHVLLPYLALHIHTGHAAGRRRLNITSLANLDSFYAIVQNAVSVTKRSSVRLFRRSTAAASAGGFAAEVGRGQQISIRSCCWRATRGPRKFWSDFKEVQHICWEWKKFGQPAEPWISTKTSQFMLQSRVIWVWKIRGILQFRAINLGLILISGFRARVL